MENSDKEALKMLQIIRNSLLDVKDKTTGSNSMELLVTRRRLLVINIVASTIIKNIDLLLEQESKLGNND